MGYTGTVLTLPERIVAFLEEVDRPLTRGEFIYFLRGPHETSQRVQAGLDDLVQCGRGPQGPGQAPRVWAVPECVLRAGEDSTRSRRSFCRPSRTEFCGFVAA